MIDLPFELEQLQNWLELVIKSSELSFSLDMMAFWEKVPKENAFSEF